MYMCGGVLVLFVVSLGNVVDGEVLGESCLAAHNKFRRMHQDTPDLTYSDDLAKSAQEWANYLTTIGFMKHSGPGQNIYWSGKPDKDHPCGPVVDFWYNEKQYYSYSTTESTNPDESTLHFTQVVWKNTKEVGCGLSTYNGGTFVVCNYSPTGNMNMRRYGESRPDGKIRNWKRECAST